MSYPKWIDKLPSEHKPMPILSFPSAPLMGVSIYALTHDANIQANGIVRVAQETNAAAAVTMMDLSLEAEAFGCTLHTSENEVPTVVGALVTDEDEADELEIPQVGDARTGLYIEAAKKAKSRITDRPVLAGVIGPFSLAGRLMDVTEALANCICDPDFVHAVMRKTTPFLIEYAKAYKAAGLDGIVMAEPLSGLLSPVLEEEFSAPYCKELIDAVQDDSFAVIYHNCGSNTPKMTDSLSSLGASAYHFGDAVQLEEILDKMPSDRVVMGNISPSKQFLGGTPDSMAQAVKELLEKCAGHKNFLLSSGCDIPPKSSWDNIRAFFRASEEFYAE